jgi:CBS domain-containing protein
MVTDVAWVAPDASCVEAAKRMERDEVGLVLVQDGSKLVGVLTDRNITLRCVAAGRDPASTRVHEVMSTPVRTVGPDEPIQDAAQTMHKTRFRRLPVVDDDGRLRGVLSVADLVPHTLGLLNNLFTAVGAHRRVGG